MNHNDVLSTFDRLIKSLPGISSQKSYTKFLNLFKEFIGERHLLFEEISPELSNGFALWLANKGYSQTYLTRIGQNFKSLYNAAAKEGLCLKNNLLFAWVSSKKGKPRSAEDNSLLKTLAEINNKVFTPGSIHYRYRNYLNLSILFGGTPLYIIAGLTLKNVSHGRVIINDDAGNTHSYLATEKILNLIAEIQAENNRKDDLQKNAAGINEMAGLLLVPNDSNPKHINDDCISIYAEEILRSLGFSAYAIKGYLYCPTASSPLHLLENIPVSQSELDKATMDIEDFFFGTRKRWYALRLHVALNEVEEMIKDFDAGNVISLFYPLEKIARKIKRKIKTASSPVLRNILFVCMEKRLSEPLATYLRGKASFFKSSPRNMASFSVIPDEEMRRFKELLSGDYEFVDISDDREFASGTQLDITGNIFMGRKAIVIKKENDGRYLVSVLGSNFRVITTKISKTFLK